MQYLSAEPIETDCSKIVYLVRSQPNLMKCICSNVNEDISKGLQREYHVYFVPRRTVVCEKVSFFFREFIHSLWLSAFINTFLHAYNIINHFCHAGSRRRESTSNDVNRGISFVSCTNGWWFTLIWTRSFLQSMRCLHIFLETQVYLSRFSWSGIVLYLYFCWLMVCPILPSLRRRNAW